MADFGRCCCRGPLVGDVLLLNEHFNFLCHFFGFSELENPHFSLYNVNWNYNLMICSVASREFNGFSAFFLEFLQAFFDV